MHNSMLIFLVNDAARGILATYEIEEQSPKAKRVLFKTLDPNIVKDDYVVVPTDTRHGMTVVKVVETDVDVDFDAIEPVKWIVSTIDRKKHDNLLREEERLISAANQAEKRKKREELREKMLLNSDAIKHLSLAADVHDLPAPETPPYRPAPRNPSDVEF